MTYKLQLTPLAELMHAAAAPSCAHSLNSTVTGAAFEHYAYSVGIAIVVLSLTLARLMLAATQIARHVQRYANTAYVAAPKDPPRMSPTVPSPILFIT